MFEFPGLLALGMILLAAIGLQVVADRVRVPTISLLLLCGLAVGPSGLGWLPPERGPWFATSTDIALTMIGFLLGGEFRADALRDHGRRALLLALGLCIGTAALVTLTLRACGFEWTLCLLLGGIAPATDPAATVAVLDELGEDDDLSSTIRSVVALDDVWGVLVYALMVTCAGTLQTGQLDVSLLGHGLWEIVASLLLGGAIGAVASPLTARLKPGRPTLLEALGLVFVCAGACHALGLSTLLASVAMGTALVNLARHHEITFREVEDLEWPFLIVFFVLAGSNFELASLGGAGLLLAGYVVARAAGRFFGVALAAVPTGDRSATTLLWTPLALMPQAGVALGLALNAGVAFPAHAEIIVTVAVASTLVFELGGPILTRVAVVRARQKPA